MNFFLSIVGLAKTLLIILLIYFGVKILARLFAPLLVKFVAKKAEERFGQQFGTNYKEPQSPKYKEGETVIDKVPNKGKSSNDNVGEYIDYEEVE